MHVRADLGLSQPSLRMKQVDQVIGSGSYEISDHRDHLLIGSPPRRSLGTRIIITVTLTFVLVLSSGACGPSQHPDDLPLELKEVWELKPNRYPKVHKVQSWWNFGQLQTTAFSLSNENRQEISLASDFEILTDSHSVSEQGLRLRTTGTRPYFLLPEIEAGRHDRIVGRIEITPPEGTMLVVYYKTLDQNYYDPPQWIRVQIRSDKNTVYFDLSGLNHIGRIRVDPGRSPGVYTVHDITIRTD